MFEPPLDNLLSWMEQALILASVGALLPTLFRARHSRTELVYCHLVLLACLVLPLVQPWRHPAIAGGKAGTDGSFAATARVYTTAPGSGFGAEAPAAQAPVGTGQGAAPAAWATFRTRALGSRLLLWILVAGVGGKLCWLFAGLWQIRRYRIGAMPLYPIPEPVQAASAVTHGDALFCISPEVSGPVTLGWLAPVVLLPESFRELGEEAQCGIACHELLHVRRHDWLMTVFEEFAGALLWFNPAIWWLLAQTRLAREELVDEEVVRLTAAREPYIEALLAAARAQAPADLAPAPLLLRRRHLTQRVHSLLEEGSMSKLRLFCSYGSMSAILAFAGWLTCASFPLVGQPQVAPARAARGAIAEAGPVSAAIPADPHEPVSGAVRTAATPAERAAALALLERAKQNSKMHMPGMPPYSLSVSFQASGNAGIVGSGELTETWMNGQNWRWTASLGGYSLVRISSRGQVWDQQRVAAIPMRVQMLRGAIFWAVKATPSSWQIRTAAVQWNGRPATCLLVSGFVAPPDQPRIWEEEEYCIDNASGLLQVHSIAPGTFVVYGYSKQLEFHGRLIPDRITAHVGGGAALDAQVGMTDAGSVDQALLTVSPEMMANGPPIMLETGMRFPMNVPNGPAGGVIQPVIVHATIDGHGKVLEEEVSSAANPALAQAALDLVKKTNFGAAGSTQREAYINVRFVPGSE